MSQFVDIASSDVPNANGDWIIGGMTIGRGSVKYQENKPVCCRFMYKFNFVYPQIKSRLVG